MADRVHEYAVAAPNVTVTVDMWNMTEDWKNASDVWNTTVEYVVVALPITPLSALIAALMSLCIVATIVGNVLVTLSVFTYRPLRVVQNFYIVSLAIADLAVALLVMPYNVVYSLLGYWPFGGPFCLVWVTCDILACTASILHLCAIAVDRYRAIHDPIAYAQKRTVRRVLVAVAVVWAASALISVPPLLGWNKDGLYCDRKMTCELTDEPTFVVYSASGSFYIPLVVMIFVYVKIYTATRARLRARARAVTLTGTTIGMTNMALATAAATAKRPTPAVVAIEQPAAAEEEERRENGDDDEDDADDDEKPGEDNSENSERCALTIDAATGNGNVSAATSAATSPGHGVAAAAADGGDDGEAGRRSLSDGFSPRRFRAMIAEATRRYGSRSRLATALDAAGAAAGEVASLRGEQPPDDGGGGRGPSHLTQFLAEKQRISLSRERRAARTMAVVMGAFVLCWLPFFLMYVITSFCASCKRSTDPRIVNFIVWLGYINSSLNPLIYTVFNVDFRRAFSALLRPNCAR